MGRVPVIAAVVPEDIAAQPQAAFQIFQQPVQFPAVRAAKKQQIAALVYIIFNQFQKFRFQFPFRRGDHQQTAGRQLRCRHGVPFDPDGTILLFRHFPEFPVSTRLSMGAVDEDITGHRPRQHGNRQFFRKVLFLPGKFRQHFDPKGFDTVGFEGVGEGKFLGAVCFQLRFPGGADNGIPLPQGDGANVHRFPLLIEKGQNKRLRLPLPGQVRSCPEIGDADFVRHGDPHRRGYRHIPIGLGDADKIILRRRQREG